MTNSELIKQIREAVEKATDGPWRQGTPPPNGERTIGTMCGMLLAVATTGENANTENNAHLIANSPTWLEELCKRLEEAEKGRGRLIIALVSCIREVENTAWGWDGDCGLENRINTIVDEAINKESQDGNI